MPTIRANDVAMYYEIHGEGEPLVLIPGLASDVSEYQRIIAPLAAAYRVIALDNRGAGRSDKPDAPYSIEMMADDAAALLTALGVGQAHVAGVSMGGRVALALALRHPKMVRSLILISTGAKVPPPSLRRRLLLDIAPRLSLLRGSKRYPQPYYALRSRGSGRHRGHMTAPADCEKYGCRPSSCTGSATGPRRSGWPRSCMRG